MSFFEDQTLGRIHDQVVDQPEGSDCAYYTNQPSPGQWVAIGLTPPGQTSDHAPALMVGTGRTELAAIRSLHRRCQARSASALHPDLHVSH